MPRLAISEAEEKNRVIRGSIKNARELHAINMQALAKLTGIPVSTLYAKTKDPDTMTIRELRVICKALKYSVEEKERIAREAL